MRTTLFVCLLRCLGFKGRVGKSERSQSSHPGRPFDCIITRKIVPKFAELDWLSSRMRRALEPTAPFKSDDWQDRAKDDDEP